MGAMTIYGHSNFRLSGSLGFILAIYFVLTLAETRELSLVILIVVALLTVIVFLTLVSVTKILSGAERIIYYHHEIAVLSAVALFLRATHQPVLAYLDITVLGLGTFLACGRIGCLLVGCCHGRPCRCGIRYTAAHAAQGFTPYYVGVPLFPVQALESIWAVMIVTVGTLTVLHGGASGSVLSWYVIAYGIGRFGFEFLRGDPDRPYFAGFSEAQWTSLVLICFTVVSEARGALPFVRWHALAAAGLVGLVCLVAVHRRLRDVPTHHLLHPRHIEEIARASDIALSRKKGFIEGGQWPFVPLGCTSLGIRISAGTVCSQGKWLPHYTVSSSRGLLSAGAAQLVAHIICTLKHHESICELVRQNHGIFHFVLHSRKPRWHVLARSANEHLPTPSPPFSSA